MSLHNTCRVEPLMKDTPYKRHNTSFLGSNNFPILLVYTVSLRRGHLQVYLYIMDKIAASKVSFI